MNTLLDISTSAPTNWTQLITLVLVIIILVILIVPFVRR